MSHIEPGGLWSKLAVCGKLGQAQTRKPKWSVDFPEVYDSKDIQSPHMFRTRVERTAYKFIYRRVS